MGIFYEAIGDFKDDTGEVSLSASFTANNGIRVQLHDPKESANWIVFDFGIQQAEIIGQALVRWAQRRRAEVELKSK